MPATKPSLDEWGRLYQAASRVKEIAPWEWMEETDIFGVQDPETGEMGFVSVMGALGQHLAIAVYLGAQGLYSFWAFQQLADQVPAEALLGIPQLQASFENRADLSKEDRQTIKALGLKFRGRQSWPQFRSFRPGFLPWYLEAWEARFLTHVLEQVVEVALQFKENPTLLDTENEEDYLVRVPRQEEGKLVWEGQVLPIPPPEPTPIRIALDLDLLEKMKQLPQSSLVLEVDLFAMPTPMGEQDQRPYFPCMLLIVDSKSGLVLGSELLTPEEGLETMWGVIPLMLLYQLAQAEIVPRQINVRSLLLSQLLQPLADQLGFEIKGKQTLRSLNRAKDFFLERFV
jgi:hypothetical protein